MALTMPIIITQFKKILKNSKVNYLQNHRFMEKDILVERFIEYLSQYGFILDAGFDNLHNFMIGFVAFLLNGPSDIYTSSKERQQKI